ncbi:hypothetical protein MPSEU_000745300 [Mayamaea pseudoterrestris]|nr:hypothetical protein MPSEU_000745300 [Mayamaea pseudoterrestris]
MDEPSRKRARNDSTAAEREINEDNDGHDDDTQEQQLLAMMDGDDFVTQAQKEEMEAKRKRELRKQRLVLLQQQEQPEEMQAEPPEASNENSQQPHAAAAADSATRDEITNEPDAHGSDFLRKQDINNDYNDDDNGDEDSFDMFSSSVSPFAERLTKRSSDDEHVNNSHVTKHHRQNNHHHEQADWDDAEGYYKAVIGESISMELSSTTTGSATSLQFRVAGVIGKGVFSTVLKCSTVSNASSIEIPPIVALKCIRHNESMAKAALKELAMLLKLKGAPGIVPLLLPTTTAPIEHRGHVLLAFSFMEYNLRDVLIKFGKGVGLSLQAVRSYTGQLLAALTQLKKHGIIHCDLKPDNILVSSDFGHCQIADFGSAVEANNSADNIATPYLVSRFYRAPEVILGLQPTYMVDLWSIAVTVVELFLGDVLFRGQTNNDMLFTMMQHLGPMSNRHIRQHLVQTQRIPNVVKQFQQEGPNYKFVQQTMDPVTQSSVVKLRPLTSTNTGNSASSADKFPSATPLATKIVKARSSNDRKSLVQQFSDLMLKCLALDPTRRMELRDALRHEFFASSAAANIPSSVTTSSNGNGI